MEAQKRISLFVRIRLIDVLTVLGIYYCMFHMMRRIVGITRTRVQESLGLSTTAVSWVDMAFITYSISQMSYGTYRQFASTRTLLYGGIVLTALSCTGYALSTHEWQLLLWWGINGIAQGTGWPTCVSIIGNWIFPAERGAIMGVWSANNAVGGVLGTMLPTMLMSSGLSWRAVIMVEVAMVLAVGALLVWRLRQHPNEVGMPSASQALGGLTWEALHRLQPLTLDREGVYRLPPSDAAAAADPTSPTSAAASAPVPTVLQLLRLRGVAGYTASYWIQQLVRYAFMAWLPTYLSVAQGFSVARTGVIAAAFDVAGVAGILLTGYLSDRLFGGRRRVKLMLLLTVAQMTAIGLFGALSPHLHQRTVACTLLVILAGFFSFGVESLGSGACILTFCEHVRVPVGPVVGLIGGFGALGSVLQGPLSGVFGDRGAWRALFLLFGLLCALSGVFMLPVFWLEREHAGDGAGGAGEAPEGTTASEDNIRLQVKTESLRWDAEAGAGTIEEELPLAGDAVAAGKKGSDV
ncbi:MFS transporter, OPA family, solute carrier family 37 (glycerol-3-phosphate transporter), member 1/2 [Strigomonas culicis]|uniref:MFS transporter, OPA family, solute carrier family 37 (Glycerol-3-phosphate transporter), member 1/2 n=1 Tax=Strigomonas culicis TaxID=28005 RepID=S9W624_9TRYP|nr:MFS transporter, OPA family, solute carrier family 37 (glycerol-3-phosphate transporter), member 1/2 [Strigomonas culicis]|eukprot:EPY34661.1 MFS transporter, OPA family, solute carrier family 37 (glycerol-3-phosphate transporter), member 1/2 [Strigomonas culicis]